MNPSRRDRLRAAAATSALAALGLPDRALAEAPVTWEKGACGACANRCSLEVAMEDGQLVAVRGDRDSRTRGLLCLEGFRLPELLAARHRAGERTQGSEP